MATGVDKLLIILGIKTENFSAVRGATKSLVAGVRSDIAQVKGMVAGFFTVAAATQLASAVSQQAQNWKDLSEQTGRSTDEIQRYDKAFKKVGLGAKDAAGLFEILATKRREALEGDGAAELIFRKFGIGEDELRSLESGADIFERIARGRSPTNQADRDLFSEMFGSKRGGKALAGAAELANLGDIKLMSKEDIRDLDESAKKFQEASLNFKIAAAPLVTALINFGSKSVSSIGSAVKGFTIGNDTDAQKYDGGVIGEMEAALQSSVDAAQKQREFDYLKRTGKRYRQRNIIHDPYKDDPATAELIKSGAMADEFSLGRNRAAKALQESAFGIIFKGANTDRKKSMLDSQIAGMVEFANNKGTSVEDKRKAHQDILKLAGERAALDFGSRQSGFKADSLAAVGGFIGGAAAGIDPSMLVQQDQLTTMRSVLSAIKNLPPEIAEAVERAARGPMGDVR